MFWFGLFWEQWMHVCLLTTFLFHLVFASLQSFSASMSTAGMFKITEPGALQSLKASRLRFESKQPRGCHTNNEQDITWTCHTEGSMLQEEPPQAAYRLIRDGIIHTDDSETCASLASQPMANWFRIWMRCFVLFSPSPTCAWTRVISDLLRIGGTPHGCEKKNKRSASVVKTKAVSLASALARYVKGWVP